MTVTYLHASKYGNGARVAQHFQDCLSKRGVQVSVHHISTMSPKNLPAADLYVFSSPGRMGKPIGSMRRFLARLDLPVGSRYAILNTEMVTQPDKKTGRMPTEEEAARWRRMIPMMVAALDGKGLVGVGVDKVYVTDLKGPLEDGWEDKVEAFVSRLPVNVP